MYRSDLIKLRKVTKTYVGGFLTETVTETTAFADKHSVKRSEFYAAQAAGMQADIGFTIHISDYDEQSEVEYKGKVYDVIRTYEPNADDIDLTCRRR